MVNAFPPDLVCADDSSRKCVEDGLETKEVIVSLSNAAPERSDEWKELYQQAILEPEYVRLSARISKARRAIVHRISGSSSNEENDKLKRALRTLQILEEVILRRTVDPQRNRDHTAEPILNRTTMNKNG
jgi:hypothetical protein